MVGIAADGGAVGDAEALALTEGLQLGGVLQVGPAEEFAQKQVGGSRLAPQAQLGAGHQHAAAGHAPAGLHRLQQTVQRALLQPLQQRVGDGLQLLLQQQQPRPRLPAPPLRGAAVGRLVGAGGGDPAGSVGLWAARLPLLEEAAGHRAAVSLLRPPRARPLGALPPRRGAEPGPAPLRHGVPAGRRRPAAPLLRLPEQTARYRADLRRGVFLRGFAAAGGSEVVTAPGAPISAVSVRNDAAPPKSPHQP